MKRGLIRLAVIFGLLVVVAGAFGAGILLAPRVAVPRWPAIGLSPPSTRSQEDLSVFWEAWRVVDRYYYGKPLSQTALVAGAIHGLIGALEDPYSVYLPATQALGAAAESTGTASGIGMAIERRNGKLVVVAPLAGSPAQRAGIRAGDQILAVDGHDVTTLTLSQALALLHGPVGSPLPLLLLRNSSETISAVIERGSLSSPLLSVRPLAHDILYVNIAYCDTTVSRDLFSALGQLSGRSVRGLVLDLRNNPGGYLDVAIELAGAFIPDGVIVTQQGRDGQTTWSYREGGRLLVVDGPQGSRSSPARQAVAPPAPMVVLVNRGTASAAEVLAAALQDHGRAVLIGETTFGKSVVTAAYTLSDGSVIHLASGVWLSPKGRRADGGLRPDMILADNEGLERALDEAIRYLMTR